MPDLPALDDIHAAAGRIAPHAVRTPLVSSASLDAEVGGSVLLKCENLQRTGSFKFRGACNAIARLSPAERAQGVVAISSGNHAQGIAEAARLFGVRATVVMPADAPAVKRGRTIRGGATVVDYDRATEDREAIAAGILAETGGVLIHPYDNRDVIAGQGTIGLEVADDCLAMGVRPDAVVIPCGGGGLSAGLGLAVRARFPATAIVLAEPAGFDDYARSLAAGHPVANAGTTGSLQDALLAPSPGALGFAVNRQNEASAVAVSDDEALAAVAFAARELKLIVEPGGAAALAALLTGRVEAQGRTTVIILSGGNIDDAMLQRALG